MQKNRTVGARKVAMRMLGLATVVLFGGLAWSAPVASNGVYRLTDFGDVARKDAAQKTLDLACGWIVEHGGGILVVPPQTARDLVIRNAYQKERTYDMARPSVTIVDNRSGSATLYPPQMGDRVVHGEQGWSGLRINRIMDADPLPFWGTQNLLEIYNAVIRGSSSVLRPVKFEKHGAEWRCYPETIRGIFPGQVFKDVAIVKDVRWDSARQLAYFTTDTPGLVEGKSYWISNKNNIGTMEIRTSHNTDSQAFDFHVFRQQYGIGDTFLISGTYEYQGDVASTYGDEQGHVFNAEIEQDPTPFSGEVESVDWARNALIFKPGSRNANKLGMSRGIINLNPKKWITAGSVFIVPAEELSGLLVANPKYKGRAGDYVTNGIPVADFDLTYAEGGKTLASLTTWDGKPFRTLRYPFRGRAYPSLIHNGVNWLGGRILGSADCGWTPAVVGRFFAVAEPGEYLTNQDGGGYRCNATSDTYRWYLIRSFTKNPDGTCAIRVERVRYAATLTIPTLYREENNTWDGHERPLRYIIAPGAYAMDIADGWTENMAQGPGAADPRTITLAAGPDRGTPFDFAADDPITQAIGADPFHPSGLRIRLFNKVPTSWTTGTIELENFGLVSSYAGLNLSGGPIDRDARKKSAKDGKPAFLNGVSINAVTEAGIRFGADCTEGALVFEQPVHSQAMLWRHAAGDTELVVDNQSGELRVTGGEVTLPTVKGLSGISATAVAAHNLRGIDVPVPAGAKRLEVVFSVPEADATYAVSVLPAWFTQVRLAEKTAKGFSVEFSEAAEAGKTVDWQLIR